MRVTDREWRGLLERLKALEDKYASLSGQFEAYKKKLSVAETQAQVVVPKRATKKTTK